MKVAAGVLQQIGKQWNVIIPAEAVDEIVRVSDSYQKYVGESEAFEDVVLGTDLYLLRSILDNGSVVDIGKEGISSSNDIDALGRPLFCQVVNVADLTRPRGAGSSVGSSEDPLYKVTLTTGKASFYALLLNTKINITDIAPGSKLLITEPNILHADSVAVLYPKDYSQLGGKVMTLYSSWEVEREVMLKRTAVNKGGAASGAPRFEPLKPQSNRLEDRFGSLAIKVPPKAKEKKAESSVKPGALEPMRNNAPSTAPKGRQPKQGANPPKAKSTVSVPKSRGEPPKAIRAAPKKAEGPVAAAKGQSPPKKGPGPASSDKPTPPPSKGKAAHATKQPRSAKAATSNAINTSNSTARKR